MSTIEQLLEQGRQLREWHQLRPVSAPEQALLIWLHQHYGAPQLDWLDWDDYGFAEVALTAVLELPGGGATIDIWPDGAVAWGRHGGFPHDDAQWVEFTDPDCFNLLSTYLEEHGGNTTADGAGPTAAAGGNQPAG